MTTTEQLQAAMPERIYAVSTDPNKNTSYFGDWEEDRDCHDIPERSTEYIRTDLVKQALSIAKAAEQMAEALASGNHNHKIGALLSYNNAKNGG